ncbi:MAG: tetratricopeptide repeat protein [Verrucomicrobiaceae bacterium]|nr:MAG: tetratricopeptide repeat protein [Verrucomicrobiaceae bacterium]
MRKPVLKLQSQALIVGIACAATIPIPVLRAGEGAGYGGYSSSIVEIEIAKRQKRISDAYLAEQEGDRLAAEQDYEGAIAKYREALDLLPLGTQNAADRNRVTAKYAKVCVIHARELGHRGAFDKARALLNNVLSENVDPNNRDARELLKDLDDPDKFNISMTEKHYQDTEEVRSLFRKGLGYYDLGQFNKAEEQFNRVLAIDPTNIAARRQLERSQREVSNYLRAARDHTRLKMLNDVDKLWETSVPGTARVPTTITERVEPTSGSQAITFKLNNITLDRIQFSDAGIEEVITYLKRKSIDADTLETDPARKGVDFILKGTTGAKPVTLDLRATKLLDAIKSVCDVAGMRYRLEPNAVIIMPLVGGEGSGGMVTKVFRVPPDFLSKGAGGGGESGDAPAADPFASKGEGGGGSAIQSKPSAISILKNFGVDFPEGATATFSPGTSRLVVRNSLEQLDNVETVIDQMFKQSVKQVFITTKFVEVTQRNTDELGFDTLIGAFNLGSSGVFGSGGTTGNAGANSDFPFIDQNSGTTTGANPISRGLRFGSEALSNNAIDALIAGGTSTGATAVSPGAFALAGVFTDPQFQIVMRALSQKKGVDLMTAPSVIARSGQRSKVEVIREFPYPTEFDPPQIPQTFGGGGGSLFGGDTGGGGGSFPVTPTTPQSFEFKNTGVTMEVEATVADDGYTIDLNLAPEVIEFEGFINYGSPIQTTSQNALGQNETLILTDNKILQPVFATRKLATQVMIWDRQTVGIGGLIREDVQSVEDKVPLFGDIPFFGRLFRTKSEEHFKKNLMIYVTGTLIDPQGQPLNESKTGDEETAPAPAAPLFPPNDVAPLTDK